MAAREKVPRRWIVDDLYELGNKSGVTYLKAIPVLILESWEERKKEGEELKEFYVHIKLLKERLERSGLHTPFKRRGSSNVLAALTSKQSGQKLVDPPLIEFRKEKGAHWINLPHYEELLRDYRELYKKRRKDDYKKLYPEWEPDVESPPTKGGVEPKEAKPTPAESEEQGEIQSLFASVEQTLRNLRQVVEGLREENEKLQARLEAGTKEALEVYFVHTSPDFHRSCYGKKVTSIKDTIGDMLKRAEHAIRISTRQMDMFSDDLIALKRRSPEIEIIVLSRGPQGAEGARKKLAGRAFEKMKQAGIKVPVDKDILHSRLVVIDTKEVLVSSADLDYTQMELEFNAGIWTNNPDAVAEAIRYFDNLLRLAQGN